MSMHLSATSRVGTIVALAAIVAAAGPARAGRADPGPTPAAAVDVATPARDGTALARAVQAEISRSTALRPADAALATALSDPPTDEDAAAMADARRTLGEARDAVAHFERTTALRLVGAGTARLLAATPRPEMISLLADLLFTEGLAHAADGDTAAATVAFAAVRRLDPGRAIDPQRYLPDVVDAFAASGRAVAPRAQVVVSVTGAPADAAVWIDGARVGGAPATVAIAPGLHVVSVTGESIASAGIRVAVPASSSPARPTRVDIAAQPIEPVIRAARLRRALAAAPDDATRASASAALAEAIAVRELVLVVATERGLGLRVWRHGTGQGTGEATGLGPVVAADRGVPAGVVSGIPAPSVAARLAPERQVAPRTRPGGGDEIADQRPWYRRRWVQASMIGGAAVLVAGAVVAMAVADDGDASTLTLGAN